MKTIITLIIVLAVSASAQTQQQSLNIEERIPNPPLGSAMDNQAQKDSRRIAATKQVMRDIEALGLYAVIVSEDGAEYDLAQLKIRMSVSRGEAYPFQGYYLGGRAILKVGQDFISVPKASVVLRDSSDSLRSWYAKMMAYLATASAEARQNAETQEANATLTDIARQQRRDAANRWWQEYQTQQQLDSIGSKLRRLQH